MHPGDRTMRRFVAARRKMVMRTKKSWNMSLVSTLLGVTATFCFAIAAAVCGGAGEVASCVKLTVEPGQIRGRRRLAWTEWAGRWTQSSRSPPAPSRLRSISSSTYRNGKEIGRRTVTLVAPSSPGSACRFGRVTLDQWPSEVALLVKADSQSKSTEVVRCRSSRRRSRPMRCAARRGDPPRDLGTILVPADWLLLTGGQQAEVEVAILIRGGDPSGAAATAWYESAPGHRAKTDLALDPGCKTGATLAMGPASRTLKRDTLHVAIVEGTGKEMWRKDIPVMLIPDPPKWPTFGAVNTKLRYDAPIPVAGGQPINYEDGWDPKLHDVVVFLPNGARFVFWRGSSYCPFWAGRSNTGFSYEWAEISGQHMVGARDCVEPLQDKELRYGRVEIVESTPARVHVRWSYQSCDLDYKVWGDFATEDYYFYPDGFGTRVMTLTAVPGLSFTETNEFISFSPQSGYPFEYVPANLVDILWPQGKAEFRFPCVGQEEQWAKLNARPKDATLLYRIRLGKSDALAAIHYSPYGTRRTCRASRRSTTEARWSRQCIGDATGRSAGDTRRAAPSATSFTRHPGATARYTTARPSRSAARPARWAMPRDT